ncbi:hypothetical protein ACLB2K_053368 [Fragaria x ananassa]
MSARIWAFGYDPNSEGYIVVKIGSAYPIDREHDDDGYCIYYPPKAIIYTHLGTGSDSWREIKTCSLETETTFLWPETFQMYFKNVCYWTGHEQHKELHVFEEQEEQFIGNVIIFFDPVDEVFHDIIVSVLGGNRLGSRDDSSKAEISLSKYTSSPLSHSIIERTHSYSVWAIPQDEVSIRVKKVMEGLRADFGGPEIEPHIPIVGSIRMTHEDMLNRFTDLQSRFISVFKAKVARVVFRSSYYQCFPLLMESSFTTQNESFEYLSAPYIQRVRLLLRLHYGYLTEEEKKKAEEKIKILDESITGMSVPITRLALYKIDYTDTTLKSWEKIDEYSG